MADGTWIRSTGTRLRLSSATCKTDLLRRENSPACFVLEIHSSTEAEKLFIMSSRYDSILKRSRIAFPLLVLLLAIASPAVAENVKNYTRDTLDEWLAKPQPPQAGLKPGEVLTSRDIARIRTYLPPGYVDQLDFPEFRAEIIAT